MTIALCVSRYFHIVAKQGGAYGLFRQSLNGTGKGTGEEWVTVYYAEPSQWKLWSNKTECMWDWDRD